VASVDDVIASLTTARESLNRVSAAADVAAELTREVQDQLTAMGAYGAADRFTLILDTIEQATARLAAGRAAMEAAIALAVAAKGGAYSGGLDDPSRGGEPTPAGQGAPRAGQGGDPAGSGRAGPGGSPAAIHAGQHPGPERLRSAGAGEAAPDRRGPGGGPDEPQGRGVDSQGPGDRPGKPVAGGGDVDRPPATPSPAPYYSGFLERLPVRQKDTDPTDGILTTPDGAEISPVASGKTGPGQGGPGLRGRWRYEVAAVDHTEGHAAAIMRTRGIMDATLYVNNPPCDYPRGCDRLLPDLLRAGARLTVYASGLDGPKVYIGTGRGVQQ
jgi:hypothetical protein